MAQRSMALHLPHVAPSGLTRQFFRALAARKQRNSLAKLDDGRLTDIGLSRAEADREAARSFWDVPNHWRS